MDEHLHVIQISARVAVHLDGDGPPDEATAAAVHGTTSNLGVLSSNPDLRELGLCGGRVKLTCYDLGNGFRATAEHESPRALGADELEYLKQRTAGDWSDGVVAGFFEDLRDCLGLPIKLYKNSPLTVEQSLGMKRRFTPWSRLTGACWRGEFVNVRAAVDAGDDINASPDGLPILHGAIIGGNVEVVRLLIERGADVRAQDMLDVQRDPLWTCVTRRKVSDDIVLIARMLLEHGANAGGGARGSPLEVARRRKWGAMAQLLEEFATPPRGPDGAGLTFRSGDRVRICAGSFDGCFGWVEQDASSDETTPVKVRIELFGREVVVDVAADQLFPLTSQNNQEKTP